MVTVSFLVSSRVQADTALPWSRALRELGFDTEVRAPSALHEFLSRGAFWRMQSVAGTRRRRKYWLTTAASLITPPGFSPHYRRLRERARAGRVRLAVASVVARDPVSARSANAMLDRFRGRTRRAHTVDVALSVSTYVDALDRTPVLTLAESWDHPRTIPACYLTESVAAWNSDLTDDWVRYQGARQSIVGYPTKLRYALESPIRNFDGGGGDVVLYAATSSSNTPGRWLFGEELLLIDALAIACAKSGMSLLIKPKPNGRPDEFAEFADRHPNVRVGRYGAAANPVDYSLDAEYNAYRLRELSAVSMVVNVGTTFALDAAAAGVPVLQLDLRDRADLPQFAAAQDAYHLSRYVVGRPDVVRLGAEAALDVELTEGLATTADVATGFGRALQQWLRSAGTFDVAVHRVAEQLRLLADVA